LAYFPKFQHSVNSRHKHTFPSAYGKCHAHFADITASKVRLISCTTHRSIPGPPEFHDLSADWCSDSASWSPRTFGRHRQRRVRGFRVRALALLHLADASLSSLVRALTSELASTMTASPTTRGNSDHAECGGVWTLTTCHSTSFLPMFSSNASMGRKTRIFGSFFWAVCVYSMFPHGSPDALSEGTRHANFFPRVFLRLSARGPNVKNFEVDFLDNRRSDRCQIFS
jgi:hypothetical protein